MITALTMIALCLMLSAMVPLTALYYLGYDETYFTNPTLFGFWLLIAVLIYTVCIILKSIFRKKSNNHTLKSRAAQNIILVAFLILSICLLNYGLHNPDPTIEPYLHVT